MTFTLNEYEHNRREVVDHLSQLILLCEEIQDADQAGKIRELKDELLQSPFQIAVVGEFNRGKSTFINALLGTRLLPSANKPTTAILSQITYSKEPYIEILYHDAARRSSLINESDFAKLVAPMEPIQGDRASEAQYQNHMEQLASIKTAIVGYPLPFLREGVRIIDTPGTNDLDPAREEITNNIIPKSDAAILLLAANKILSDSERSLLRDRLLSNDIQKIFFVVNFKDRIDEQDYEKVMKYAADQLREIVPSSRLFLVSTKHALNAKRLAGGEALSDKVAGETWPLERSGLPELEQSLADFLQYERGAAKLNRPIDRSIKAIRKVLEDKVSFEQTALQVTIHNVIQKVQDFQPKVAAARAKAQEAISSMELELGQVDIEISRWYEAELRKIGAKAAEEFDRNRSLAADEIRRRVEDGVAPLKSKLFQAKKQKMNEAFKHALEKSSSVLRIEQNKLRDGIQRMMGLHSEQSDSSSDISLMIEQTAAAGANRYDFFEDVLTDLYGAWDRQSGVIGKIFVGAGLILTHVVQGLFSWLGFGPDPKQRMREQLVELYANRTKEKIKQHRGEWSAMMKFAKEEVARIARETTDEVDRQLRTLEANASLQKSEAEQKRELLRRWELRLRNLEQSLNELRSKIDSQWKRGEEFAGGR